jgi:hypothetical protein
MTEDSNSTPDFEINEDGFYVATRALLLRRGFCCGNGCQNCPYPLDLTQPLVCRINPYSHASTINSEAEIDLDTPGEEVVM